MLLMIFLSLMCLDMVSRTSYSSTFPGIRELTAFWSKKKKSARSVVYTGRCFWHKDM